MITLSYQSGQPIYEQIVEQIKIHVMKGYLQPGDVIPSVRKMALEVGVTPNTVAKAYQELERQKVIVTIPGKGTFISEKTEVPIDKDKLEKIEGIIKGQLIELKLMGFSSEDTIKLIKKLYESL